MKTSHLSRLSDAELLARLAELVREVNRNLSCLLRHLAELDSRRLYLEQACSSLFGYCVGRLGFSEAATYHRITAARLGRRYPVVFEHIETGRLHLAAVRLLAPHLTDDNHGELLGMAAGKSKRQLEELLASRFPKPDVPTRVRKLPRPNSPRGELEATGAATSVTGATRGGATGSAMGVTRGGAAGGATGATGAGTGSTGQAQPEPPESLEALARAPRATECTEANAGAPAPGPPPPTPMAPKTTQPRDRLEPLSPARYKVQFTASAGLMQKIDEARELASHHVNDNDLARLFEKALDLFIANEKKRRFAATDRPRPRQRAKRAESRHVPAEVRRAVWERDQGRCSYVDEKGRRCEERRYLEFDHEVPRARGGPASAGNIRLLCRAHNQQSAKNTYGREYVDERVRRSRSERRGKPTSLAEPGSRFGWLKRHGTSLRSGAT